MIANLAVKAEGFTSNAYLVQGDRPVLVDAGTGFDVVSSIRARTQTLDAVVLTHTHDDHVGNLPAVREAFDVDVWGFDPDHELVDRELGEGDSIQLGDDEYRALHTPGHAPDHLCLYSEPGRILFSGDLVFPHGSFGRTDLPGGDRQTLIDSIEQLMEVVDDDLYELYGGHGTGVVGKVYKHLEFAAQEVRQA